MRIKDTTFNYFAICVYTIGVLFCNRGLFFYLSTVPLWLSVVLMIIRKRRGLEVDLFTCGYLVYMGYLILMVLFGQVMFPRVSLNRIISMSMNFVLNIQIMSILTDEDLREKYMRFFTRISVILLCYISFFSRNTFFSDRLGFSVQTPIPFGSNGNGLALSLLLASLFDYSFYLEDKKRYRIIRLIFLALGILLSGSRKAIFSLVIMIALVPIVRTCMNNRKKIVMFIKYGAVFFVSIVVVYLLLTRISVLYNVAGKRIEETLVAFFTADSDTVEQSLMYRESFVALAKQYFYKKPVFGIGIDNFAKVNYREGYYAHNDYWEILTGSGVVGAVLYYWMYILIIFRLIRYKSAKHASTFLAFMFILILYNFQMVTYLQRNMLIVLFLANSVCLSGVRQKKFEMKEEGIINLEENDGENNDVK